MSLQHTETYKKGLMKSRQTDSLADNLKALDLNDLTNRARKQAGLSALISARLHYFREGARVHVSP